MNMEFQRLIIIFMLSFSIGGCVSPQPYSSPQGTGTASFTFIHSTNKSAFVWIYREASECRGRNFINMEKRNSVTLNVPAGKEVAFSFSVLVPVKYRVPAYCMTTHSFTPEIGKKYYLAYAHNYESGQCHVTVTTRKNGSSIVVPSRSRVQLRGALESSPRCK